MGIKAKVNKNSPAYNGETTITIKTSDIRFSEQEPTDYDYSSTRGYSCDYMYEYYPIEESVYLNTKFEDSVTNYYMFRVFPATIKDKSDIALKINGDAINYFSITD